MPPKIRELIAELERSGFVNRGGKGNYRNFEHILGVRVTISGKSGNDAKAYQVKLVKDAVRMVKTR